MLDDGMNAASPLVTCKTQREIKPIRITPTAKIPTKAAAPKKRGCSQRQTTAEVSQNIISLSPKRPNCATHVSGMKCHPSPTKGINYLSLAASGTV